MCPMEKTNETPAVSAPATVHGTKITIGDLEYDAQQQTLRHGERLSFLMPLAKVNVGLKR